MGDGAASGGERVGVGSSGIVRVARDESVGLYLECHVEE